MRGKLTARMQQVATKAWLDQTGLFSLHTHSSALYARWAGELFLWDVSRICIALLGPKVGMAVSLAEEIVNGNAGVEDDKNGDQELAAPRITEILTRVKSSGWAAWQTKENGKFRTWALSWWSVKFLIWLEYEANTFSENWRCIWSYWRWEKNMWLHCLPLQNCLETDFNDQVWKDEQVWKGFAWKTWIRIWRDEKSGKVFPERRRKVYIQYIYNNKEWTGK